MSEQEHEPAVNSSKSTPNPELEEVKKRISELEMKLYLNK